MPARFGDMLLDRRRQMGLSIQQVANTIKIRPQIIEFFEQGNFASMPPRGYAQGMISSYARFLGLNPRDVVNAYFDDLMAYERETSQRGGRFQEAAGYVNARSSTDNGRFLMVEGGRSNRYGQRPPQAGYVTENGSGADIREQRDRFRNTLPPADSALPASRGNIRNPRAGYGDGGYANRSHRAQAGSRSEGRGGEARMASYDSRNDGYRMGSARGASAAYSRGGSSSRSSSMRSRSSYQNRSGRVPQGSRVPGNAPRSGRSSRSMAPQGPANDPRFVYGALAVILCLLVAVIVLLFRGCTPAKQQETKPSVTQTVVDKGSAASSSKKSSKDDSSSDDEDDSDDTAETSSSKSKKTKVTKVKVKVAKGKTAWIEVKVDGKSVYGAQATGPFEQEYTPESSIEITTSKPSDVTVTKNGEKVRYDTKTSGVARVTITVPKTQSSDSSSDSDSNSSDESSTDSTTADSNSDGTDTQSSDSTSSGDGDDGTSSNDGDSSQSYSSSSTYETYSSQ